MKRWIMLSSVGGLALGIWIGRVGNRPSESERRHPDPSKERSTLEQAQARGEPGALAKGLDSSAQTPAASIATAVTTAAATPSAPREAVVKELARLKDDQKVLQAALAESRRKVAELEKASGLTRERHQFDLDREDWRKLGQAGALMDRIPCQSDGAGQVSDEVLDHLGSSPEDRPVIAEAYRHSRERLWAAIGPQCAAALGGSMEQARAMGVQSCQHLVLRHAQEQGNRALQSLRRVAAFRAGDGTDPATSGGGAIDQVMLALTDESRLFEAELAQAFGPEDAHRVVFTQDGLCFTESTFGLDRPLRADGPWGSGRGPQ